MRVVVRARRRTPRTRMKQRKASARRSDCGVQHGTRPANCLAPPSVGCRCMQRTVGSGGVGTFDELWEGVAEVSLGFKDVPIVCVNVNGYYDSFQQMLERSFADKLIYRPPNDLLGMESTASVSVCGCILLQCVRMSSLLPLAGASGLSQRRLECTCHAYACSYSMAWICASWHAHASTLCMLLLIHTSPTVMPYSRGCACTHCDAHA